MNIYLHDPRTLRIESRYHPEIVERLKSLPEREYDKATKHWFVPTAQADKLMAAFPLATFDYAAIGAACDAEQQRGAVFGACLADWGIALRVVGAAPGALIAEGESVSPLIQELVTARAADLRRYCTRNDAEADTHPNGHAGGVMSPNSLSHRRESGKQGIVVTPTTGELALVAGIKNAAKREQEQAARGRGRHPRRKAKPVQRELFDAT